MAETSRGDYVSIATMTSKGQVTIPIDVRKELNIEAGSKLEFIPDGQGAFRIVPKKLSVMDLLGSIPFSGKTVSLDDMDEAIAVGAVGNHAVIADSDSQ